MKAYIYNATDSEARARNLIILEVRSKPNGKGQFLYSATATSADSPTRDMSLRMAQSQIEQWAAANGYEIAW